MKAFHGNKELAEHRLAEAKRHVELDMLVRGTYGKGIGKDFKGCSIGCLYGDPQTGMKGTHERGEKLDGIPKELLFLFDDLFESLPENRRNKWHVEWVQACVDVCGADLSLIWHQFDYWVVHDPNDGVIALARENDDNELVDLIDRYEQLLKRASCGDIPSNEEFARAARAARDAAWDARDAARAARDAARAARAAWDAARDAAWAAAWAARAARAARAAWDAWDEKQANKLLDLIRAAAK